MLQTVGLVAREPVGYVYRVAWFHPLVLVNHRNEWILLSFPGDPVIPTEIRPGKRFIPRLKLRLKHKRMPDGVRSLAELCRNALQRIEIDSVSANLRKQLRHS